MGRMMVGAQAVTGKRFPRYLLGDGNTPASPAPVKADNFAAFLREVKDNAPAEIKEDAPMLVGAVAGGLLFKRHRVLGAIGGASIGHNAPALFNAATRNEALVNMGQTGAGVIGSLVFSKSPIVGFVAPWLLAGLGIHLAGMRK